MDSTKKLLKLINIDRESYLKCLATTRDICDEYVSEPLTQYLCANLQYKYLGKEYIQIVDSMECQLFSNIETQNLFCDTQSFLPSTSNTSSSFSQIIPINSFSLSIAPISCDVFKQSMKAFHPNGVEKDGDVDEDYGDDDIYRIGKLGFCKEQSIQQHVVWNHAVYYTQKSDYDVTRVITNYEQTFPHTPKTALSFFQAIRFCNELSKLHGLTPYYNIDDKDWMLDDLLISTPSDYEEQDKKYNNFLFNDRTIDIFNNEEVYSGDIYVYSKPKNKSKDGITKGRDYEYDQVITRENYECIVEVQKMIKSYLEDCAYEYGDEDDYDGEYDGGLEIYVEGLLSTIEFPKYQNLFHLMPFVSEHGFAIEYDLKEFRRMNQAIHYGNQVRYAIYDILTLDRNTNKNKTFINENANGYRLPYSWELLYILIENENAHDFQKKIDQIDVHNPILLNTTQNSELDVSNLERLTKDDFFFLNTKETEVDLDFNAIDNPLKLFKMKYEISLESKRTKIRELGFFNDTSIAFLSKTKQPYDLGVYDVIGNTRKWVGDSLLNPSIKIADIDESKISSDASKISRDMVGMTFGIGNSNFKKLFEKGDVFDNENPYKINLFDKDGKCNLMDVEHASISQDDISMFICKNIPKKLKK